VFPSGAGTSASALPFGFAISAQLAGRVGPTPRLCNVPAYRAWKRACKIALKKPKAKARELPRFHDTRHAYATSLLAAGLGSHAVAALLGHADASLVDRRYGHALPDELATAGDTLSAWRQARAAKA
jgi:integrase